MKYELLDYALFTKSIQYPSIYLFQNFISFMILLMKLVTVIHRKSNFLAKIMINLIAALKMTVFYFLLSAMQIWTACLALKICKIGKRAVLAFSFCLFLESYCCTALNLEMLMQLMTLIVLIWYKFYKYPKNDTSN